MNSPEKLIVFVDYQNAYRSAREAFFNDLADHHTVGQFNPLRLGELLVKQNNATRADGGTSELYQVRMYCGLPDSEKDPKGNGARLRQIQIWGRIPGVQVVYRPLRYPAGSPPVPAQEKGVDVHLAVDVMRMALQGEYQTGIIFSRDTDLRPVIESMLDLYSQIRVRCSVAAWQPEVGPRRSLQVPNRRIWCDYITSQQFRTIEDLTDYRRESQGTMRPSSHRR